MKYRIEKKGEKYYVMKRGWWYLCWMSAFSYPNIMDDYSDTVISFETFEEAKAALETILKKPNIEILFEVEKK